MKSVFHIEAMDCSAEEQLIRKRLGKVPEVDSLSFDLVNRRLTVEHRLGAETPLLEALSGIGLPASEASDAAPSRLGREDWQLGMALAVAAGAEILATVSGSERSPGVLALALLAIALGGVPTFKKGLVAVRTLTLNINFLMCLAVVGAFAIGSYPEAAMVTVLFAIAERIESFALQRAGNAIRSLLELAPDTAIAQALDGGWSEVPVLQVAVGDLVRVKPGGRIPLDGEVVNGASSVNQAPITGESAPIDKEVGSSVFAGSINGEGVLEFRVTSSKGHTTLDRIIQTVQEAQASRAPTQRFVDAFAKVYTPVVVALALLVATVPMAFGEPFVPWLYKALVLLVIACPCALVISTPVTVVSGLASAARQGILIKGGVYLESGRNLARIALDKTGTLTQGKPRVVAFHPLHGFPEAEARQIAASLDHLSAHPVAKAIAEEWDGELLAVGEFKSLTGRGVSGVVAGRRFIIGSHRLVEEEGVCCDHVHDQLQSIEERGETTIILAHEKEAVAMFAVADTVRPQSVEAVRQLHALGLRVTMLTGDNAATAQAIGNQVGIDDVRAELLPEAKLAIIEELLLSEGSVGMVGDGVNDAPALARASIGFAMGAAGTDTAIETADVALMDDDLRKLPAFIRLSRRTASILGQNIALAVGIKILFFGLAVTGHATLWMAVFADMGTSLLVVGNGLRLLASSEQGSREPHGVLEAHR